MSEMLIESGLRPERNFTIISNNLVTDTSISTDAFRIMCYLLSKPKSWRANEKDISRQLGLVKEPGRRSKVYARAIRELKEAGYLEIRRGGHGFSTWTLREPKKSDDPQKGASIKSDDPQKGSSPKGIIPKREHGSKTLGFNKTVYLNKKEKDTYSSGEKCSEDQNKKPKTQKTNVHKLSALTLHESKQGNMVAMYRGKPLFNLSDQEVTAIARKEGISERGCMTYEALRSRIEDEAWDRYEELEGHKHG